MQVLALVQRAAQELAPEFVRGLVLEPVASAAVRRVPVPAALELVMMVLAGCYPL
jgi:hypothetical protein